MAGAQTEQNEVIVVIDEPRNGRAAAEIDHLHAGTAIEWPSSPTSTNLPFLIVADDTIELRASKVWIFPLTNFTSREPAQRSSSRSRSQEPE